MNNYRYTLIVSQYYHSYHVFVVKFEESDYIQKFTDFIIDLYNYKRDDASKPTYLGDIGCRSKDDTIWRRYNLNDEGDLYIINEYSIDNCVGLINRYKQESIDSGKGYIKKQILNDISKHHSYSTVKEIVAKHFEIL